MRFSDIPGLESEKVRLIDSFKSNEIHHAILFNGQLGSANLSLSLAFASYINFSVDLYVVPSPYIFLCFTKKGHNVVYFCYGHLN